MPDPQIDYPRLIRVSHRALRRHHISELGQVICSFIIDNSFALHRPFACIASQADIMRATGLTKGKISEHLALLKHGRAVQVNLPHGIYTFVPPSQAWPWGFQSRLKTDELERIADRLEAELACANKYYPLQPELWEQQPDFDDALNVEIMREALVEAHRKAILSVMVRDDEPGNGGQAFEACNPHVLPPDPAGIVVERPPKSTSVSQGETSAGVEHLTNPPEQERPFFFPPEKNTQAGKQTPLVPESGTELVPYSGTPHLNASISASAEASINALRCPVPDSGTTATDVEQELMDQLRQIIGPRGHKPFCQCGKGMCKYGGFWLTEIRRSPVNVREAIGDLKLRLLDSTLGPPQFPGGWLRDRFNRIKRCRDHFEKLKSGHQ